MNRYLAAFSQLLRTAGVAIALIGFLVLSPPVAQAQSTAKAPVVLDGRTVFRVSASGDFSAQDRADLINLQLREVVQTSEPAVVEVEERNQLPTIVINDRYLLTVTERDTILARTPMDQALLWAEQIQALVYESQTERGDEFVRKALLIAASVLLVDLILHLLLGRFWHYSLRPGFQRLFPNLNAVPEGQPRLLDLLLYLSLAIARSILWLGSVFYVMNLFPVSRRWTYSAVSALMTSFTAPIISLGKQAYSIIDLLILVGLLLGLVGLAGAVTNVLRSRILSVSGINRSAQEAVAIITKYTLIFIGSIVLLQIWGLDITSLAIVASALGVGIGFGFQDIAKNFGSGVVLLFERPVQVGDFVEVGEYQGTIERIGARSTIIRTLDQISIIVPNSRLLEGEVKNWTYHSSIVRLHLPVHVAYHSEPNLVRLTLLEATKAHRGVLTVPPPQVWFQGFGEHALNFELLVWTAEPSKQFFLKSELYFRIEALLRQRQIEVPLPQRDLHIRSGSIELSPQLQKAILQLSAKLQVDALGEPETANNGNHD
ncbi:mechanosensitive ion channel family protein [Trichocoleus sp. FACHB-262]|uniref:mechanosensitive ion channel family protein n=1 Tax=Trichocoleus sp. FACHB-262 TaxID=2692869 RepID=UPI001689C8B8|nr:mechanosensitive ion channel domain-containing protein [Trichocoleus sp. FACHB-262]MBD2120153.1 mechanosensitive ion channel [Trichocoleus sp. FACHB-262]